MKNESFRVFIYVSLDSFLCHDRRITSHVSSEVVWSMSVIVIILIVYFVAGTIYALVTEREEEEG